MLKTNDIYSLLLGITSLGITNFDATPKGHESNKITMATFSDEWFVTPIRNEAELGKFNREYLK